jgi:hypothetical protein
MSYILLLVMWTGDGITSQSIAFNDFKACNEARDKIEQTIPYGMLRVRVTCVKQ